MENEKISENIKKYNDIMKRYYDGEFGSDHLTIQEILIRANEENLLNEMDLNDLKYLYRHSTGIIKMMFLELQKKKLKESEKGISLIRTLSQK